MTRSARKLQMLVTAGALCLGTVASAGDDNTLYIKQDSLFALEGNTLTVDQSSVSNTRIAGAVDGSVPALQEGGGNTANIDVTGDSAVVALLQSNPIGGPGNSADLSAGTLATVLVNQVGIGNTGSVMVTGLGNTGALDQQGNGNNGDVSVSGVGTQGKLVQVGNNNDFGLTVAGRGTNVTYQQIGDNLTPVGAGPSVVSNGGTVIITQINP